MRDYANFVDTIIYDQNGDLVTRMKEEFKKTIQEDDIDDAIENIMNLVLETKYEW